MTNATHPVMLSAIQPTNVPTLGVYIGALKNWVKLQNQYDCVFFAVDLHSITLRQDPAKLRELTYQAIAAYLASGIDPRSRLFSCNRMFRSTQSSPGFSTALAIWANWAA